MAEVNPDRETELDLFGEPYEAAERGRGRPPHRPSRETVNRVILGFARGWSVKKVALSIGVSVPTLRQYYFSQVARRDQLALMMESVQLGRLNEAAEKGNVTAEKELMAALERGRLRERVQADAPAPVVKPAKLGKKEAAKLAAAEARGGLYDTPPAPSQMN